MRKSMLSLIPIILATSGCFSLGRDTPLLEQYVLGGTPTASAGELSPDAAGVTVGLRRLDLTPYLASPEIVVRRGVSRMIVSEYHRWGEDPVAGINRAFAGYLGATATVRAVDVAPWPVRSQHDFVLQLHVSRFEGSAPVDALAVQGDAHLLASWELHRPRSGAVLARGVTDYRAGGWRIGDYPGLVALLDGALERMAGDIVACMARIDTSAVPAGAAPSLVERPLTCSSGDQAVQ